MVVHGVRSSRARKTDRADDLQIGARPDVSLGSAAPQFQLFPALPWPRCIKHFIFQALAEAARKGEPVAPGIIIAVDILAQ